MRLLLILAVMTTGAPALAAPETGLQVSDTQTAPRVCARFEQRRSGSRRICLMAHQWQVLLGPDWRQLIASRNADEDMAAIGARTRPRPEPPEECMVCRHVSPPRSD
jgi:hypothetical protein